VNLAAPGALPAMLALRASGSAARFWACIASGERGLAVGLVEPVVVPLDPDVAVDALGPCAAPGARVVTTGADVDALMSLRQALSRKRASVSMAWDGKQAADLLAVVKPQAVVVDLDLPRRDGYGVVAQLGTVQPPPLAVVCGGGEDAPMAFAAQLADSRNADRIAPLPAIVADLAARSEPVAPAVERRAKLRALQGTGR
jgi:CheY-like chemotaxis protein